MSRHRVGDKVTNGNKSASRDSTPEERACVDAFITPGAACRRVASCRVLVMGQVKALLEIQEDTLESTKRQVDKKQTRTVEERDQEIQEEEQGALPEFNEVMRSDDCRAARERRTARVPCPLMNIRRGGGLWYPRMYSS